MFVTDVASTRPACGAAVRQPDTWGIVGAGSRWSGDPSHRQNDGSPALVLTVRKPYKGD